MNLHVPQSTEAEVDLMVNGRCANHIVTAQRNGPVNGIVQDGLVAAYLLTNVWQDGSRTMVSKNIAYQIYEDSEFSKEHIKDMINRAKKFYPEYIKNNDFISKIPGSLFISIVFPYNFCYTCSIDSHADRDEVVIEDGILLPESGPLEKKTVGAKNGSVIHVLWKRSPECAMEWISDFEQITDRWLPHYGFSMGVSDCLANTSEEVAQTLIQTRKDVDNILKTAETEEESEKDINNVLNSAMAIGPRIAKNSMNHGEQNAMNIMRNSGGKGSVINLAQIVAFLGQQNLKGQRIPKQLSDCSRCLPCFLPGDNSPEARGFIESNYINGLKPYEAFFHAATGVDGIISTSLKTADTGYIQKRLSRKLEDLKVWIDGTVRDANGKIISFMYGDDGMDAKKLVTVKYISAPFFVNPLFLARQLNSDALQNNEVNKNDKPRYLRNEEINLLLQFINYSKIDSPVIKQVTKNARNQLLKIINKVKIYENKIPDLCATIRDAYNTSKIQYGSMVGFIATSAIGEPTTQMVLNTFHLAGFKGKDASLGIPRFKEIINTTKQQRNPGCTIYFNHPMLKRNAEDVNKLEKGEIECKNKEELVKNIKQDSLSFIKTMKKDFEETYVYEFLYDYELKYLSKYVDYNKGITPTGLLTYEEYVEEWWVKLNKELGNISKDYINESEWVIILYLNIEKMYSRKIDLKDVASAIENKSNNVMTCIASPNIIGKIEVHPDIPQLKNFTYDKINKNNIDLPPDSSFNKEGYLTEENLPYYLCRDVATEFIKNVQITGINGLHKLYPREDLKTNEWVFDTDGTNFQNILSESGVDSTRTMTDDMYLILNTLGIEAARRFLFDELTRIISFDGTYLNPRHITLLVDSMTNRGNLLPVSRYGILLDEAGPMAKIMFEKSIQNAKLSSAFGLTDNMNSVASNVAYGKVAKSGSGAPKLREKEKIPIKPPKVN